MRMTYSTAADRARREAPAGAGDSANRELAGLVVASVLVLAGLFVLYRAQAPGLAAADEALANRAVIDLNALASVDALVPVLRPLFPSVAERRFVADRIEAWSLGVDDPLGAKQEFTSVGTLARLTVPERTVRANRRLEVLRSRLGPAGPVRLFSQADLAAIKPLLVVRTPSAYRRDLALFVALLLAGFYIAHVWARLRRVVADPWVLPAVHLLCGIGLLAMLGLRDPLRDLPLFARFAQGVAAGCVVMSAVRHLDLQRSVLSRLSYVPLIGAVALSALLIAFGSGPGTSDAKVNLLGVQPVEAIRLLVLLFFAGYFANRWELLRELREPRAATVPVLRWFDVPRLDYVLPVLVGVGLILVFFFLQKDLGPALVLSSVFLALYGVARRRITMVAVGFAMLFAGFFAGYWLGVPRTVVQRVAMWQSPFDNAVRGGDQVAHALWSLASGAFAGMGLGGGDASLVPAAHTDLVLVAVGEEIGWIGLVGVFALAGLVVWRAMRIALRASGDYAMFLSLGVAVSLGLQLLLIAGGLLGLMPLTGVVTPFLSYGRSAMLANFAALGLLLGASDRSAGGQPSADFAVPVRWLAVAMAVVALIVIGRITDVQVLRADQYVAAPALSVQADGARRFSYNPRLLAAAGQIVRGTITDRRGVPLATGRPEVLAKANDTLSRLGADPSKACPDPSRRCYPFGGITYHLLGDFRSQTNWAAPNTSFVERDSDPRLRGYNDHARVVEVADARTGATTRVLRRTLTELVPLLRHRGEPNHPEVRALMERPRDLQVTVDIRLQQRVAAILKRRIEQAGRQRGAVVVMNESGELLASVSYPWPEPMPGEAGGSGAASNAGDAADARWLDRARYGVYPPGSSFKIVTSAAALRARPELAQQTVTCVRLPDGRVGARVPGWTRPIRDDPADREPHGTIALAQALAVSCNAYFANLGARLGASALADTAHLFESRSASRRRRPSFATRCPLPPTARARYSSRRSRWRGWRRRSPRGAACRRDGGSRARRTVGPTRHARCSRGRRPRRSPT